MPERPDYGPIGPLREGWGLRFELLLVGLTLALATYLRLAYLDFGQFRPDDANLWEIARNAFDQHRLLDRGMVSSIGVPNGPFQAYLLMLAMPFTSRLIGPYIVVALLNVLAVAACWGFTRAYFGRGIALIAALLFAVNPWAVVFSRRLLGNDMMPLFTVLLVWSLCDLITKGRRRDGVLPFLWLAILTQVYVVALVHLVTAAVGFALGLSRVPKRWFLGGVALFALLATPYLFGAVLPNLGNLRNVTEPSPGTLAYLSSRVDLDSLRAAFLIVGNEGYQAYANQGGQVLDATRGVPDAFSLFARFLMALGIFFSLTRVIGLSKRREFRAAAPYLLSLLTIFLPVMFLVDHASPVYPNYLLAGYPMQFLMMGIGVAEVYKRLRSLLSPLLPLGLVTALAALVVIQLLLARVFFQVIPEYWVKSDYGLPLAYAENVLTLTQRMIKERQLERVYVAGAGERDVIVYQLLRHNLKNVFHFSTADTFVVPREGSGPVMYLVSERESPGAKVLWSNFPRSEIASLEMPGSGVEFSFFRIDAKDMPKALQPLVQKSTAADFAFEKVVRLNTFSVERDLQPGTTSTIALLWTAPGDATSKRYNISIHLIDSEYVVYEGRDMPFYFSSQWCQGDHIVTWITMSLPLDLTPRAYWWLIKVYRTTSLTDFRNLLVTDATGNPLGDGVRLGPLLVPQKGIGEPEFRVKADFGGKVVLWGYDLDRDTYHPGDEVNIQLYWRALTGIERDYTVFVHLLDGQGKMITQHDGYPDQGRFPTTAWQPGRTVLDRHSLTLPHSTPPGTYTIEVGLYYLPTGERLGGGVFKFPLTVE
ncbi:MAG: glycosyltransferase family 39 protein [Chloroflexi bacterium]|nr:glycosyltransferase family 39 protein [Chloroflexota bacterium]MCL5074792.1 glycosyltransferase family 39 protein [Chloroflexota bacterium]